MPFWIQLAWFVGATLLSIALAPKPPSPKPATLEDFDFPNTEEDRVMPVFFGTNKQTGPQLVWYGDFDTDKIKKGNWLSGKQTVGFKYFVGFHFVCGNELDALTKVEIGEKEAWAGSVTANTSIAIDEGSLFGGGDGEGGVRGTLDVMFGRSDQTQNAYLAAKLGADVPWFFGTTGMVWRDNDSSRGGYIGNSAYAKPWAFTHRRILKGWLNDSVWQSSLATVGVSMNAAHIMYQGLTDPRWGGGIPTTTLDNTSWSAAAAVLQSEGFGLDLQLNGQMKLKDFIDYVNDHIGGVVRFNHQTGLIELKLIRADYVAADLEIFDEDSISSLERYETVLLGEGVNEITATYTDPDTRKTTPVMVQDLGHIRSQGAVVSETLDFSGITDRALAARMADRELRARSTPLKSVSFLINRSMWGYAPGDVFKFSWAQHNASEVIMRVAKAKPYGLKDNKILVEAIEDIYSLPGTTYTVAPTPPAGPGTPPFDPPDNTAGGSVISTTTTAPPVNPDDGDSYYVPTGATGAWVGHEGEIATWNEDEGEWEYTPVTPGTIVLDGTTGGYVTMDGLGGTTGAPWEVYPWKRTSITSPAAWAAQTDNFAVGSVDVLRATLTGAQSLTGIAGGVAGRLLLVHNVDTADTLTLVHESASSTAANRFILAGATNVSLPPNTSTLLQYDSTTARWRIIGGTGSGSSSSSGYPPQLGYAGIV